MALEVLLLITLLDSICFGLTYPFLSTYIQSLGADHIVVGMLAVGYLLCNLISSDIISSLKIHERRFGTLTVSAIVMLTHLSLILTNSYWLVIFGRCVYSVIGNQTQKFCKEWLMQNDGSNIRNEYLLTLFSILNGCGYIIGPIIAGLLYNAGFFYIGLLAAALTLINICLFAVITCNCSMSSSVNSDERTTSINVYQNINDIVDNFQKSECEKNWDLITMKLLHVSSIMIFYGKFSQILKYNFEASPVTVGNTYAFMNGLTFAATYLTTLMKEYAQFSPVILVESSLIYLGLCLFVACYSPYYILYMIMCIPIVCLNTFLDSMWKELFATRTDSLNSLSGVLKIATGFTTPLVFGVLCNNIGHHAVIIFSVIPIIVSIGIINMYTKRYNLFAEDIKSD